MKDFLCIMLGEQITEISYSPVEQLGAVKDDRRAVYDVLCTNEKGEHFIVEMQNAAQEFFLDRLVYYASMLLQGQAPKGKDWNFDLKAVYVLAILNFEYFTTEQDKGKVIEQVYLTRSRRPEWMYDKLRFMLVELPKFTKTLAELDTPQDRWLYNLRHLDKFDKQPPELRNEVFNLLFNIAGTSALTKEERYMYDISLKMYSDYDNTIAYAEKQGLERGIGIGEQRAWNEANTVIAALKAENERLKKQ
jgi:predicted transposase/invertase (TIGR01784 family)